MQRMRELAAASLLAASEVPSGEFVVDYDELPGGVGKRGPQRVDETRNVLPLIEGWNHDAELGSRALELWRHRSVKGGHEAKYSSDIPEMHIDRRRAGDCFIHLGSIKGRADG